MAVRVAVIALLCLFSIIHLEHARAEVTDTQWKALLKAASDEDWNEGFDLARQYLQQLDGSDERLPRLRYIYLYTAAGKVSEGSMSYDRLPEITKNVVGKQIVLPYRQISTAPKPGDLNFIVEPKESKGQLFVAATNKAGTTIHDFEYIKLKDAFDLASHDDQYASVSGVVDDIKPNPNKSAAIVFRIYISSGCVAIRDQ